MKLENLSEVLKIKILRRSNLNSLDYWDANWLEAEISANTIAFKASFKTNFRVDELLLLNDELIKMINNQKNQTEFLAMEDGLQIGCKLDSKGFIVCSIKLTDQCRDCLEFHFRTESSSIQSFTSNLNSELQAFPLIGEM